MEFSDALIEAYRDIALVDHLHLPVQSGSDRILMAMKRGHTAIEYKSKIRVAKDSSQYLVVIGFHHWLQKPSRISNHGAHRGNRV